MNHAVNHADVGRVVREGSFCSRLSKRSTLATLARYMDMTLPMHVSFCSMDGRLRSVLKMLPRSTSSSRPC